MYLIFRPKNKINHSQKAFSQADLEAVGVALSETVPVADYADKLTQCLHIPPDFIIVTSTAAARLLNNQAASAALAAVIAIGTSTNSVLAEFGIQSTVPEQQNSEGVLNLACLQNIKDKRIVIIKGEGGRGLLEVALSDRHARVEELNIYHRQLLALPQSTQSWQPGQIHCIIATSGEQISQAFGHYDRNWLIGLPWIVVSERTAQIAARLGVKSITTSVGASDDALVQAARLIREP